MFIIFIVIKMWIWLGFALLPERWRSWARAEGKGTVIAMVLTWTGKNTAATAAWVKNQYLPVIKLARVSVLKKSFTSYDTSNHISSKKSQQYLIKALKNHYLKNVTRPHI
jgi:hypothetical protein